MLHLTKTLKIGITGGIGVGKTTVCRIFEALHVPIYDADSRARALMTEHKDLVESIKTHFGQAVYLPDGQLDRAELGAQVFGNPAKQQLINSLVHPHVGADFLAWCKTFEPTTPYVLKEAALMIESRSYQTLDKLIVVTAPETLRIQRVLERDKQRTEQDIRNIMNKQMPEKDKIALADYVIDNDESRPLIPQIVQLHQIFCEFFAKL